MEAAEPPTRFWENPWSINDDDPAPDRAEFFTDDEDCQYEAILGMEDFFQHNAVFYNLLKGNTCHSDSYMTGVAYANLLGALDLLDKEYSPTAEDWMFLLEYWLTNPNQQPPLKMVACEIARRYDIDPEKIRES